MKFSRDHLGVRLHPDCVPQYAHFSGDNGFRFLSSLETAVKELKFPVDEITLHCDPEVSWSSLVLISPEFDPERKGFD